jgi:Ca2+-binding RTX toxin-like protein
MTKTAQAEFDGYFYGSGAAGSFTGRGINEFVVGHGGADTLRGNGGDDALFGDENFSLGYYLDPRADLLYGGAGNDTLDGGAYGDLLDGGAGIDCVSYGSALTAVTLKVGTGGMQGLLGDALGDRFVSVEQFSLSQFGDSFTGGRGADSVDGAAGNDTLDSGAGHDSLQGGGGNDVLTAGAGNDQAVGGFHADLIYGGDGNDRLRGDGENYSNGRDTLYGGNGDDYLWGDSENDALYGGAGNDTLIGGWLADTLNGGSGYDRVIYDSWVLVNLLDPSKGTYAAQGDVLVGINAIVFQALPDTPTEFGYVGGAQAITVINANPDPFQGSVVRALAGTGAERFVGFVQVDYSAMTQGVRLEARGAGLVGSLGAAGDRLLDVGALRLSAHADMLLGLGGSLNVEDFGAWFNTGAGRDLVTFAGGRLKMPYDLYTGADADTVTGSGGAAGDIWLGSGNDVLKLIDVTDGQIDTGTEDLQVLGEAGDDLIQVRHSEGIRLEGGEGRDTLAASDMETTASVLNLIGGAGNDSLILTARNIGTQGVADGGEGNDSLDVRAVHCAVDGGAGDDVLAVTIYNTGGWTLEFPTYYGVEILGGAGNDRITLATSNLPKGFPGPTPIDPEIDPRRYAVIDGGAGNDSFAGAANANSLTREVFVFTDAWGRDRITEGFDYGIDILSFDVDGLNRFADFDSVTGNASQTRFAFGAQVLVVDGLALSVVLAHPETVLHF